MHIAHLTDTHIVPKGDLLNGTIDTGARLAQAVTFINNLSPKADAVLVCGDLVNEADQASYDHLLDLLAPLNTPHFLIPGNHDDRVLMQSLFGGKPFFPVTQGFAQYVVDEFPVRLIALDSTIIGKERPDFCDARAAWLKDTLAQDKSKPTLAMIHHPPIYTGIGFYDQIAPQGWTSSLHELITAHDNVKLVACGHVHSFVNGHIGNTRVSSAAGSAFLLGSEIGEDAAPWLIDRPGDVLIHYWTGSDILTVSCSMEPRDEAARIDKLAGMTWRELKDKWTAD